MQAEYAWVEYPISNLDRHSVRCGACGAAPVATLIRPLRDLLDDPKDFGASVDGLELVGHSRGARTIVEFLEHGPHGLAQRLRCRIVGRKIDYDPGPCHARRSHPSCLPSTLRVFRSLTQGRPCDSHGRSADGRSYIFHHATVGGPNPLTSKSRSPSRVRSPAQAHSRPAGSTQRGLV